MEAQRVWIWTQMGLTSLQLDDVLVLQFAFESLSVELPILHLSGRPLPAFSKQFPVCVRTPLQYWSPSFAVSLAFSMEGLNSEETPFGLPLSSLNLSHPCVLQSSQIGLLKKCRLGFITLCLPWLLTALREDACPCLPPSLPGALFLPRAGFAFSCFLFFSISNISILDLTMSLPLLLCSSFHTLSF